MLLILTCFILPHWYNIVDNSVCAVFPTTVLLIPLDFPREMFFQLQCCCYLLTFHMHSFSLKLGGEVQGKLGTRDWESHSLLSWKSTLFICRYGRVLKQTNKATCIRFCQNFIKILSILKIFIFLYLFFRILDLFCEYYSKQLTIS